jgi:MFS family permease
MRLPPGGPGWLLAICGSRVGTYAVYIAYAATLPVVQREWSLSGVAAGSIASAFQAAYAVSLMGCSVLADRVGARRVFLWGTVASAAIAVAFAALARDYWSGLGLYPLLALALGGTYTTGILLVAENISVERRGRAMGIYLAGHSLGLALALVVAGAAIPRGGYVLAFWLLASGAVFGGVLAEHPVYVARAARGTGAARAALESLCRSMPNEDSGRSCRGETA